MANIDEVLGWFFSLVVVHSAGVRLRGCCVLPRCQILERQREDVAEYIEILYAYGHSHSGEMHAIYSAMISISSLCFQCPEF